MGFCARLAIAICVVSGTGSAAEPRWLHLQSGDLEVFSTAGERNARETLKHFEQIRSFFTQTASRGVQISSASVRIIAFSSKKEYDPYRLNEFAVAYARPGTEHDYIVLSGTGEGVFTIATHEYVHLVAQHEGLRLPPWLNEGLADLYSTLRQVGNQVVVGIPVAGRYQGALREKWVPLTVILAADRNSPYYNEKSKAGSLYNEGWALVHMLVFDAQYKTRFHDLVESITAGTPSETALTTVYGKPLKGIEDDLQFYLRNGRFYGVSFPVKIEKGDADIAVEPAPLFDVNLMLASLLNRPGHEDEVGKKFEVLAAQEPSRSEPWVELGYLALRKRQTDEARKDFGKGFELGSQSPRMLWDYGRMIAASDTQQAIRVFNKLLEKEPDRRDVRIELAAVQLGTRDSTAALETLKPMKKIGPEDEPRLFRVLAYAQAQAGLVEAARATAERWASIASTSGDNADATRLLNYLSQLPPGKKPTVEFAVRDSLQAGDGPSLLTRRDAPAGNNRPPLTGGQDRAGDNSPLPRDLPRPSVSGTFVELQCSGTQPRVVLQTESGNEVFLIDDPSMVFVDGKSGVTMDLTCGPQSSKKVRVEYVPAGGAHPGVKGLVRAVHFTPE